MSAETILTIVGNLTADPELRTTGTGTSVTNFTIASTPRIFNRDENRWEDGQALFMRCSAWRDLADHCAASLSKGMRVVAQGRLSQRSYTANDGSNRTVVELTVDEIGPSLRYATAQVTRTAKPADPTVAQGTASSPWGGGSQQGYSGGASQQGDPWGAPADGFGGDGDEPEF
jgi:single-strand DNA-binding protein